MKKFSAVTVLLIAVFFTACNKPDAATLPASQDISDVPVLPEEPYDYGASDSRVATLGRVLFYDKHLSFNNSVSCASCHQQSRAFCDNKPVSTGLQDVKTARNSPSLFGRQGRAFWDGRATSMVDLALRPIRNTVEMKFDDIGDLVKKLNTVSFYKPLFRDAFGTERIDSSLIKQALGEFLNSFNFSDNKFNRSERGQATLTGTEHLGSDIFFGKGGCSQCHHIKGDFGFEGYGSTDEEFNIGLDLVYKDQGMGAVTGRKEDNGVFMVPVLLNVEHTAPYMHDGRFRTLEEVVEHYNSGVKNHENLAVNLRDIERFVDMPDELILAELDADRDGQISNPELLRIPPRKLNLSENEKRALVAFLKILTDPSVFSDPRFSNPFKSKS